MTVEAVRLSPYYQAKEGRVNLLFYEQIQRSNLGGPKFGPVDRNGHNDERSLEERLEKNR